MEKSFFCASEEQTKILGMTLGSFLKERDVVCLNGVLGAGKTTFAKAIAQGMEIAADEVTSPTFTIMNVYESKKTLQHFDLYRIDKLEELADIGFAEYIDNKAVSLIEWANLFPQVLPLSKLIIEINILANGREFVFLPQGERFEQIMQEVACAYTGN